jgi:uncharacterized membrane protein (GlpM family)
VESAHPRRPRADETLSLLGKGALSGALVACLLAIARSGNTELAGVLVSAPLPQILTAVFLGRDGGPHAVRRFALYMLLGSATYGIFTVALWQLSGGMEWRIAVVGSLATRALTAAAFMRLTERP